jgi:uncharacterized membrane protein YkoI
MTETMLKRIFLLLCLSLAAIAPAGAGVEDDVRILVKTGQIKPFEAIRSRVVTQTKGDYIGAEFDMPTRTYRFRFLDNGSVINVDVDARTGQRVRRTNSY